MLVIVNILDILVKVKFNKELFHVNVKIGYFLKEKVQYTHSKIYFTHL
jgi:hypothetical protein